MTLKQIWGVSFNDGPGHREFVVKSQGCLCMQQEMQFEEWFHWMTYVYTR